MLTQIPIGEHNDMEVRYQSKRRKRIYSLEVRGKNNMAEYRIFLILFY